MKKTLITMGFVLFPLLANAAETIKVYTRFSEASGVGKIITTTIKFMNEAQSEYDFVKNIIPGAGGETADLAAIERTRAGEKIILINSTSSFTMNRFKFDSFDRDKDLVPLHSLSGSPYGIMVREDSNINSLSELISHIRSQKQVYNSASISSANGIILNERFMSIFNLNNVKPLNYRMPFDILRSVRQGESLYTIWVPSDMVGLKPLAFTGDLRSKNFPSVPTTQELGISDLSFTTLSLVSIPKENLELGKKLIPLIKSICNNEEYIDILSKLSYDSYCYNNQEITDRIKRELKSIEKYSHLIK